MTETKARITYQVSGDYSYGVYHVTLKPKPRTATEDREAKVTLEAILRSHADLLAAAEAALYRLENMEIAQFKPERELLRAAIAKAKEAKC